MSLEREQHNVTGNGASGHQHRRVEGNPTDTKGPQDNDIDNWKQEIPAE